MNLKYVPTSIPLETEIAVVIIGPLAVIGLFIAGMLLAMLLLRTLHKIPAIM